MRPIHTLCCVAWLCFMATVRADRVNERIYKEVLAYSPCIRLLNGTHQIGCNSKRGGNVGTLHVIENQDDLDWLVKHGPHEPYMALLAYHTFTLDVVTTLRRSGKVNGIMIPVLNDTDTPDRLSPDQSCPNVGSEMYKEEGSLRNCRNVTWNEHGTGLMFEDLDIPIVKIHTPSDIDFMRECYQQHNAPTENSDARSYPLCALQLKVAMDAAKDTPTCIRRSTIFTNLNSQSYCDALGDHNVYSFVHLRRATEVLDNNSVIIAAARLDAFSMFLTTKAASAINMVPGADSAATGIITLLAVAEAIGKVKKDITNKHRPIMFTFFNGEAFDYIGSSRMVYEMERKNFPAERDDDCLGTETEPSQDEPHSISLDNLYAMVELSQVGLGGDTWIHSDPVSGRSPTVKTQVSAMIKTLMKAANSSNLSVDEAPSGQPLPSASLQTFLKHRKQLPGLLLTDHKSSYTNKYYNSHIDDKDRIGSTEALAVHLTRLATTVAQTLYEMSTGVERTDITANQSTVTGLLHCFLQTAQCDMFNRTYAKGFSLSEAPYSFYVGVSRPGNKKILTHIVHNLLASYLGDRVANVTSEEGCKKESEKPYTYLWMQGKLLDNTTMERDSFCVRTIANYSTARSPAFDLEDYDWSSQQYSTWSESVWGHNALQVRIFLLPSKEREIAILCGGLAFFLVSTTSLFFVSRKFGEIFESIE